MKTCNRAQRGWDVAGRSARAILIQFAVGLLSGGCWAATFIVGSRLDAADANPGDGICATPDNQCSLRAAIEEANTLAGADAVQLRGSHYKLSFGELQIAESLEIQVSGGRPAVIDARFASRILRVLSSATLTAANLRIQHGMEIEGGGILVDAGATLVLTSSAITRNRTVTEDGAIGGGLVNRGITSLTHVEVSRNKTRNHGTLAGGGIYNSGTLYLSNCSVSRNRCESSAGYNDGFAYGGGIENLGQLMVDNLLVQHNRVAATGEAFGGGVHSDGIMQGSNVRFVGNIAIGDELSSDVAGGGLSLTNGSISIDGLTATANRAVARRGTAAGGGLSLNSLDDCVLSNVEVTSNRVLASNEAFGGGVWVGGPVQLTGGSISLNSTAGTGYDTYASEVAGGGIWGFGESATLTDLVISFNRAIGRDATDGGISPQGTPFTMNNVIITHNTP